MVIVVLFSKLSRSANPSEPPFDELLEQLKSRLPEPLFATVSKKVLALQYAELKIQVLRAAAAEAHPDVWSGPARN